MIGGFLARLKRIHRSVAVVAIMFVALLADGAGLGRTVAPVQIINGREVHTQKAVINFWVQIAIMIVSAVISYALTPKPPSPKPASLQDFDVPTAEEGTPVMVVFGTVWVKGPTVLWYGDLRSQPIRSSGGKK